MRLCNTIGWKERVQADRSQLIEERVECGCETKLETDHESEMSSVGSGDRFGNCWPRRNTVLEQPRLDNNLFFIVRNNEALL